MLIIISVVDLKLYITWSDKEIELMVVKMSVVDKSCYWIAVRSKSKW